MSYLALAIPENIQEELKKFAPVEGLIKSEKNLHITLFYFPEKLNAEQINYLNLISDDFFEKNSRFPLTLCVETLSCFPPDDFDNYYFKVSIFDNYIKIIREGIANMLVSCEIKFAKDFDYTPHITLGYYDRLIEPMHLIKPIEIKISEYFLKV